MDKMIQQKWRATLYVATLFAAISVLYSVPSIVIMGLADSFAATEGGHPEIWFYALILIPLWLYYLTDIFHLIYSIKLYNCHEKEEMTDFQFFLEILNVGFLVLSLFLVVILMLVLFANQ